MKTINLNRRKFLKFILVSTGVLTVTKILGLNLASPVKAWTTPPATPPDGNVAAPLNVGGDGQVKTGGLSLGGLVVDSTTLVVDAGNDRVGIGTAEPTTKLDINGQIRIRGGLPATGRVLTSDATGLTTWTVPTGGLPAGITSQTLRHDGTTWVANSNIFNTGTNVGIGTTMPPTERLQVIGTVLGTGVRATERLRIPVGTNMFD